MKRLRLAILLVAVACLAGSGGWERLTVRESGHGFMVGDVLVLAEYGYSDGGDRLRYAIFRTWRKGHTAADRMLDQRVVRDFWAWPCIRGHDGRLIPAGTDGQIYFFDGDDLKTMRVRMDEHTDTVPLEDLPSLDEIWRYLQQFRVDPDAKR
jgi:hypothetical protein